MSTPTQAARAQEPDSRPTPAVARTAEKIDTAAGSLDSFARARIAKHRRAFAPPSALRPALGTFDALPPGRKEVGIMTVLLVVLTFAVFVLVDYLLTRREEDARPVAARSAPAAALAPATVAPEPVWVAGYQLPENLHYHRGHTWARVDDARTVTVGIDDFARRLVGRADAAALPETGSWLRQGEPGFGVRVDGRAASFVSPIEGEVVAVNEALRKDPALASDDPYGRGWVLRVRPARIDACLRNLFSGGLARRFMEDARHGLDLQLMALSGSVLQDGGEPVADFARHLSDDDWRRLVGEFLLT
jgi:glycine cleavage system H lipoate-binding protein